jgi:hypothetical protein
MSAYARRAIAERQRQNQIKSLLSGNNHTLIQMNSAEFVDYIISVKMKQGKSRSEVVDWLDELLEEHNSLSSKWKRIKDPLKAGAGLYPLFDDIKALVIIAEVMKRQGNTFGKFKIKIYNGSPAIIMTSYPGIRAHLTGTHYLASNPRLFTIGVGKLEASKAMKGGFVVSLLISVTFHSVDLFLNDQKTWHDLVAGIAVDMAVVGAAIATTFAVTYFATAFAGAIIVTTAAIPLLIVVSVGIVFTALTMVFSTDPIADAIAYKLRELESNLRSEIIEVNKKLEKGFSEDPYAFFNFMFGVPTINLNRGKNEYN